MTGSLPAVSRTAVGVAALRAAESRRPDRLFDDPYAAAFAEAGRSALPAEPAGGLGAMFYPQVVIRTRFYDGHLLGSGCGQVVLLAAGLDTRAFRLPWPDGTRLFELDLPEVLAFKDQVLAGRGAEPACARVVVPADLREDWATALRGAGFDPAVPTAWLAEGLLMYLTGAEAERLLTTVGELAAPGSRIAFEHRPGTPPGSLIARAKVAAGGEHVTSLWRGGLGGRAPEWLATHGWQPSTVTRAELAAAYGRPSDDDATAGGFVTAVRLPPRGGQSSTLR
ncbi:SAM-dependent methyltransferase [Amycolatopsis rifamycinica]|uniref:S-adenosyl-L-methionine-dependent methyltransferase n=1 Tax=Amycolatopsis rifamycinica TaxID=287986 RepID=A0A066U9L3_9PSEU|nr:SAM-dependent methyltransferase [Amycolatopsis rifamycinica]KDN24136.1 methyltransferase [Amycolatopsis rifamycinica]